MRIDAAWSRLRSRWLVGVGALLVTSMVAAREVSVDGYGLLADLRLKGFLEELASEDQDFFDPGFVEDGFFLLNARLANDGYLQPTLRATIEHRDGREETVEWPGAGRRTLEAESRLRAVRFEVEPGVHYYFEDLAIEGLSVVAREAAERYFYVEGMVLHSKEDRTFAPAILQRGVNSLRQALRARGYREAAVEVVSQVRDDATGAVQVSLSVDEGSRTMVAAVEERLAEGVEEPFVGERLERREPADQALSDRFVDDAAAALRVRLYRLGFPDATVRTGTEIDESGEGSPRTAVVQVVVEPGPRVRLEGVRFEGNEQTSTAFLHRKVGLEPGAWLDRGEVERARDRLGRLGVFSDLEAGLEQTGDPTRRTVVFSLEEGVRQEAGLLVGWGSYEQLRGGVEYRHHNLWGRAHRFTAQALISMKSEEAAMRYRIPALYNLPAGLQASLRYLRRDEVSFERQEGFAEVGLDWRVRSWSSLFEATYRLEMLKTRNVASDEIDVPDNTRAGAVVLHHRYDSRDAVLAPERGLKADTELELAAPAFGSEVSYQRLDTQWAWHRRLGETYGLHVGLRHRALFSWGSTSADLPLNKRFFPGGENSIRGYPEGQAAPRDAAGNEIGAEVTTLLNLEWTVSLTRRLELVFFSDNLFQATSIDDYPGAENLHSVGGGLRYNTPLGPLRLEYGYNLNPRPGDPGGALHFSLGYPF